MIIKGSYLVNWDIQGISFWELFGGGDDALDFVVSGLHYWESNGRLLFLWGWEFDFHGLVDCGIVRQFWLLRMIWNTLSYWRVRKWSWNCIKAIILRMVACHINLLLLKTVYARFWFILIADAFLFFNAELRREICKSRKIWLDFAWLRLQTFRKSSPLNFSFFHLVFGDFGLALIVG